MSSTSFTVVALPVSRAADALFHVSLFVAPRLDPGGSDGVLSDFPTFERWGRLLARGGATITLSDDNGEIPCRALVEAVDEELWTKVFPKKTRVRGRYQPDWDHRYWRTFSSTVVTEGAKDLLHDAIAAGQTSRPAPGALAVAAGMRELKWLQRAIRNLDAYDESEITQELDERLGERPGGDHRDNVLAVVNRTIDGTEGLERLMLELHRARRFYDRPEGAFAYANEPKAGQEHERPRKPTPDFHDRCVLVGDHPGLLRRLGLVVDLLVEDVSRLEKSAWLSAAIAPDGDPTGCSSPRTTCTTAGTGDLVTVPVSDDWSEGRLRLGDEAQFSVLDLDVDGSALKLERFLWTLPRLMKAQKNGDPVHAAPPALRSSGLTVVGLDKAARTQAQMRRQQGHAQDLDGGDPPLLNTEDVTRGTRIEVWDDTTRRWYSLHSRRITVDVHGHPEPVLERELEEGYVQTTAAGETPGVQDSPVHVHEALFGWDGWSLSAPKPGLQAEHRKGEEVVVDPTVPSKASSVTPVVIHTKVEPGTLPRLRYGRAYAFRGWAVDLAGNVRAHGLARTQSVTKALTTRVADLVDATRVERVERIFGTEREDVADRGRSLPRLTLTTLREGLGAEGLRDLTARIGERRGAGAAADHLALPTRAELVARPFQLLEQSGGALRRDTRVVEVERIADLIAASLAESGPITTGPIPGWDLVSPLRPFLRWDPVLPPAIVPRRQYTAGESLLNVVIRSGVTQDLATGEVTVTPPGAYAKAHSKHGYVPVGERHVVPPKVSQTQAELHGAFDDAIGSGTAAAQKRGLAIALRESGTFYDQTVPTLKDATKVHKQEGVHLVHDPGAPKSELKTLPLDLGDQPGRGQYVVHDTDDLRTPYLPDTAAAGISIVFPEAGKHRGLSGTIATEGFTVPYTGTWPEVRTFRLALEDGATLAGEVVDRVVRFTLPPGDVQRLRVASTVTDETLDVLGAWRGQPDEIRQDPEVAEAARDGWLWALTPYEDVTLVHAVPRPVEAPRPTLLVVHRRPGETTSTLRGGVDVHGPSTDSLAAEAHWIDQVDDLALPAPEARKVTATAFTVQIRPTQDFALLWDHDSEVPEEALPAGYAHGNVHHHGDTRHRRIRYQLRATTRFREYFEPDELAPGTAPQEWGVPVDDGRSVVGPAVELSVPSSAIPAPPLVHSVVPLFRWSEETDVEQPMAVRRRRRTGVRVYLERPWYSSGDGELLGVLLACEEDKTEEGHPWISHWGGDPMWVGEPVADRSMEAVTFDALGAIEGVDDRARSGRPVAIGRSRSLAGDGAKKVDVVGYRPQYSVARQLWYVDVALDPQQVVWPFLRLAVARYQPESLPDLHLSKPVRCDYVQLTPERTATVARLDARHVRIVVDGAVVTAHEVPEKEEMTDEDRLDRFAASVGNNRSMAAYLQRRDADIDTDLGWETVAAGDLVIRGRPRQWHATWVGTLEAPEDIPVRRPGTESAWRVVIEECETLFGDPASLHPDAPKDPVPESRVVYLDEVYL